MNLPITAIAQYSTQQGLKSTQPIIGGDFDCEPPCDCGSPAKYSAKNKGQQSLIDSGPKGVKAAKSMGVTSQMDGSALPKKGCKYN